MPQGTHYMHCRLAGPKSPPKKCGAISDGVQVRPMRTLMFMDMPMTQTSKAEIQSDRRHTETDSTLRLSGAVPSGLHVVLKAIMQMVRCVVETFSRPAPQASKAGWHQRQAGTQGSAGKHLERKQAGTHG